jgi:predicted AlkP superfamily phosphohydrolase/phosphomutase
MDRINERFRGQIATEIVSKTLKRPAIMRALRKHLPARLQHAIGRAVPAAWRDAVVNRALTAGYDWARTPGLSILASVTGFVRFNLRGRESAGMLEPGSELHRNYAQLVAEGFRSCRIASSGEALVKEVTLTEEEFGGERSSYLPDVVVSWNNHRPASRIESEMLGAVRGEQSAGRTGNHRPEGFAIVVEPGRTRRGQNAQGEIVDLASMVSRLLNCAA